MEKLGAFILIFLGILWIENSSKSFLLDGSVQNSTNKGETYPLIGEEVFLISESVFKKAEGIAIQKTKEEIAKVEDSIKKKMDILNSVEAFKGKTLEEMAAYAVLEPILHPENAETFISFQKGIANIYKEKNYLNEADVIFSKNLFSQISYDQKDRTDVQGKFKIYIPTKGVWFIACKNTEPKTLSDGSEIQPNTLFWFVEVPLNGFKDSALFGKYRMPFQPVYIEVLNLTRANLYKPSIK